jgi:Lectin C-type domain
MLRVLAIIGLFLFMLAGCSKDSSNPDEANCPEGTVKWTNGHCYEAVLALGLSWEQARDSCIARGGHLVTITSAEENEFVFSLVSSDSAFWYLDAFGNGLGPWLGGYQPDGIEEPDSAWQWVTNEPFVYTNWETGQPGDLGNVDQNRLRFFKAGGLIGDRWDDCEPDNPLAHRRGYIFERE